MSADEKKDKRKHKHHKKRTEEEEKDDLEVPVLTKAYFFEFVGPNLPPQTHTTEPATMDPQDISLFRICSKLCQLLYNKKKKLQKLNWPEQTGPPLLWSDDSDVTKVPFTVHNSEELDMIIVTCRGTFCVDDVVTDLMGNAVEVCGGYMHQGVYDTASYVFYNVQTLVKTLSDQYNGRQVVINGHSLGASVAAALCEMIHQSQPGMKVRCIAMAPPPSVDWNLWETTRERCMTVILDGDFVPYLSLENVLNITFEIMPLSVASVVQRAIHRRLKKTAMGQYDPNHRVQLCPPGECYLLVPVEEQFDRVELRKITGPEYFDRLVRGLIEKRHMCQTYCDWIQSYFLSHT